MTVSRRCDQVTRTPEGTLLRCAATIAPALATALIVRAVASRAAKLWCVRRGGQSPADAHCSRTPSSLKTFFLNTEAIINRGISLLQTLHQRRYWEQFTWHPRSVDDQFAV